MMIGWIIFFAWLELYSAGIAAAAKRNGAKNYLIYLVPFAGLLYRHRSRKKMGENGDDFRGGGASGTMRLYLGERRAE